MAWMGCLCGWRNKMYSAAGLEDAAAACWLRARLCWLTADLVIAHALEWPSLTVQWLPVREGASGPRLLAVAVVLGVALCMATSLELPAAKTERPAGLRREKACGEVMRASGGRWQAGRPGPVAAWPTAAVAGPPWPLPPPQKKEENREAGSSKQQLILGTHTSEGEQNYLMRAEVQLPLEESETNMK